jgi:hypothetical protein
MKGEQAIKELLRVQMLISEDITEKALIYIHDVKDRIRFLDDCVTIANYHKSKIEILQQQFNNEVQNE